MSELSPGDRATLWALIVMILVNLAYSLACMMQIDQAMRQLDRARFERETIS